MSTMTRTVARFLNEPQETSEQIISLLKRELAYMNNITDIYVTSSKNTVYIKYKTRSKLAALTKLQVDVLKEYGYEFSHVNFSLRAAYFIRSEVN